MAGYELIFPSGDKARNQNYETLLKKANEIWDDFNIGKQKNKNRMMNEAIKAKVTNMIKANAGLMSRATDPASLPNQDFIIRAE